MSRLRTCDRTDGHALGKCPNHMPRCANPSRARDAVCALEHAHAGPCRDGTLTKSWPNPAIVHPHGRNP